ncbi:MAG: MATE family efflux transporter [Lachnospiraceae bacterium]
MTAQTRKKSSIQNMTQGNPLKILLLFSMPLMVGNIFQQLYTVVDTAIVGKVLGVEVLAALGTVDWLNWMTLGIIQGLTQGFAILMAQKFGAKDYSKLRHVIFCSVVLSVFFGIVLAVAAQLVMYPAMGFLKVPKEILPIAIAYLRVLFCGIPVVMAYNLSAAILRSMGDGKTPLAAMAVAAVVNIVLDLVFVIVFHWGVEGAAIATIIAQLLSAVYCILKIRKIEILKFNSEERSLDSRLCKDLLGMGLPMAFQNAILAVGGMIVQTVVNGFGVAFIAGFTAVNKLYGILEIAAISFGYATTTYTGQNMGAGKDKRIAKGVVSGLFISVLTSVVITVIMLVFGTYILQCFISIDTAQGKEALSLGKEYLGIMSLFLSVLYVLHIVRNAIQGMGNTIIPMISGIAEFLMRTGAAFLLPFYFGEDGILYAEVMAWLGADFILIPGYFYVYGRLKKHRKQIEIS